jgi:hypothetical protein
LKLSLRNDVVRLEESGAIGGFHKTPPCVDIPLQLFGRPGSQALGVEIRKARVKRF